MRRGWALWLLGCARVTPAPVVPAHDTPAPVPPSFHCEGRERRRFPVPPPAPPVAPGRLLVRRLPGGPAALPTRDGQGDLLPFGGVRLRVVAEAVPLPRFAAALAEALRIDVLVPPADFGVQVTFASPDATVEAMLESLRDGEVMHSIDAGGWLRLGSRRPWVAAPRDAELAPLQTELFVPLAGAPAAQLARYFCDQLASDRGSADVVAGRLIVRDIGSRTARVTELLDAFRRDGAASAVPTVPTPPAEARSAPAEFSCRGPEEPPVPIRERRPPVPSGRLVVQRLPLPAGTVEAPSDEGSPPPPYAGVRLRVVAEAVHLAPFAAALSEALHLSVVVPPDSTDVQVSVASTDVTVDRLLRALRTVGVDSGASGQVLRLGGLPPPGGEIRRVRNGCTLIEPVETRVLPPTPGVPYDQVADYYCRRLATSRGAAHVVGPWLVIDDTAAAQSLVEHVVRALAPTSADAGVARAR